MSILLFCENASAIVTLEAGTINGRRVERRQYCVRNHIVDISGYPDAVLHHDAEMLLGHSYRQPTPEEQDLYYQTQRMKGMIQE